MASLMIQFNDAVRKRRTIRLVDMPKIEAERIRRHVKALNRAAITGVPFPDDTARWIKEELSGLPWLAKKLAGVGLMTPQGSAELGEFIKQYIEKRTDIRPSTRVNLEVAKNRLVEFFGADKPL